MQSDKKKEAIRVVKYALFAASAGIIQFGTYTLFTEFTPMPTWLCNLISLVLSVIWNFTFNRRFTFKSANNVPIAMLKVAAYYAVFTPVSAVLSDYLVDQVGWNPYVFEVANMLVNFVTEFLYQRLFVFGKTLNTNDLAKKEAAKEAEGEIAETADLSAEKEEDDYESTAH